MTSEQVAELQALGYSDGPTEPADPKLKGVVKNEVGRASAGYNIYTDRRACSAILIDNAGVERHAWRDRGCLEWGQAQLLQNGDLLVPALGRRGGRLGRTVLRPRSLLRLSWDGALLWRSDVHAHHSATELPDGRIVALTTEARIVPGYHSNTEVLDDRLTVLKARGRLERLVSLYDVLSDNAIGFVLKPVTPTEKGSAKGIDLFHINTVTALGLASLKHRGELFRPSNVLITLRHQNTLAVIDLDAARLVWAWGQKELDGPHDGTLLPNGHFLVFDNGLTRGWSRVLEVDPQTQTIVWQYPKVEDPSLFTKSYGAAVRLDNGNTLLTDSDSGHAIEVTPEGEMVWELYNPNINSDGRRQPINGVRRYNPALIEPRLKQRP
jgi:hypothetical protein